jgi:3-oxoadipate enol-lactonase
MALLRLGATQVEHERQGQGRPLLLLHSLLTEMTVFDAMLPALAARYSVVRLNLPGFGQSTPVALETVGEHADHVARVLDALALGRDTAVFGNGFGAFVALELALRHGTSFDRLIVADTLASFPEPARAPFRAMAQRVRSGGMQAVLDAAIGRMFPPHFSAVHPEIVAARRAALAAVDAECFARACLALAQLDLRPSVGGIGNSTLVACGALDQTTPPTLARALAEAIPGARYREIAGSGHCPMLEQPEALFALIDDFARGSSKRSAS